MNRKTKTAKRPKKHLPLPSFISLSLTAFCISAGSAGTVVVDPADDVQACIEKLQAGDTLKLKPGRYTNPILIHLQGTEAKPIRIEGSGRAEFIGLVELKPKWTPAGGGIFEAKVDRPVSQLFVDGELMTPARWPDMTWAERWDNDKWPAADAGSQYGKMVDSDLAASGLDFSGCVAVLNIGSWQTFRRVIDRHQKGADHFTYPTDPKSRLHKSKHPVGMDRYCIYGRAALDAPGEWFYDSETSTLSIYPPRGKSLAEITIESKQLPEAIVMRDSQHVILSGIGFRATTLRVENSNHCTLEDIEIEFGSAIANPFGANLDHPSLHGRGWSSRKWFGESSVDTLTEVDGKHNVIRNLTARFCEGPALTASGENLLVENCLFEQVDWHGLDYGFGVDLLDARGATVRRVTLDHCGGSEGLRLSNQGKSLVEFCHLHHCGLRQSDGGVIQTATAGVAGTEIRYNWIHDHNAFHWGGNGIRGDDRTRGLLVHHNVIWNCREKGIVTKGDGNRVYHNTCFDNPKIDILLPRKRLPGKDNELTRQNENSEAFNNIAEVTGSWGWEKDKEEPYGQVGSNLGGGKVHLRDPAAMDFRLAKGSKALGAGRMIKGISHPSADGTTDLGAHERGAPHWTAGYIAEEEK